MGEDYNARIEALLSANNKVDMSLRGKRTDLVNLATAALARAIAEGADTWDEATTCMKALTMTFPVTLNEAWQNKSAAAAADKTTAADTAQNVMQEA